LLCARINLPTQTIIFTILNALSLECPELSITSMLVGFLKAFDVIPMGVLFNRVKIGEECRSLALINGLRGQKEYLGKHQW
jgi:hypothetical protein